MRDLPIQYSSLSLPFSHLSCSLSWAFLPHVPKSCFPRFITLFLFLTIYNVVDGQGSVSMPELPADTDVAVHAYTLLHTDSILWQEEAVWVWWCWGCPVCPYQWCTKSMVNYYSYYWYYILGDWWTIISIITYTFVCIFYIL